MAPNPAATAASGSADTVDAHSEASDIPPGSNHASPARQRRPESALCGELLRHRFPRYDRPAILDHRAGGQVSASGGGFGIAAGQANGRSRR